MVSVGGCCTKCKKICRNTDVSPTEYFGRTGLSWLKIFIFYVFFYIALAGFFMLMMYIFFAMIDIDKPFRAGKSNDILGGERGGSPNGVGSRPKPAEKSGDTSLLWIKKGDKDSMFVKDLTKLVDFSSPGGNKVIATTCNLGDKAGDKTCGIEKSSLGPCGSPPYGYDTGSPCVAVKLNRIRGWVPKPYKDTDDAKEYLKALNKKVPTELGIMIRKYLGANNAHVKDITKGVWIHCEGEHSYDRENMGIISYHPAPFIPAHFFPFKSQKGYVSPFVMVRFNGITPGVIVQIKCKSFAANLKNAQFEGSAPVEFDLLVEA